MFINMVDFLGQIKILPLNMKNLFKISDYSRFFRLNCRIPGFTRFCDSPEHRIAKRNRPNKRTTFHSVLTLCL